MKVKSAVDEDDAQWIAPNGDLWYQRNLDRTYEGTDYRTVTYYDLLNSQALLEHLTGQRDVVFDRLIASKQNFLAGGGTQPAQTSPAAEARAMADPVGAAAQDENPLP